MIPKQDFQRKLDSHLLVSILFAASLALGDYGIRFYVSVLRVSVPHYIVAGITEPVTTKLFPAIAVIWVYQWKNIPLVDIRSHPYWLAFVGGISLGFFERFLYVIIKGAPISPGFILAPWIHVLNSVIIAGFVFSSADTLDEYRLWGKLVPVIVVAMIIHVFWNTWGVVLVHQVLS